MATNACSVNRLLKLSNVHGRRSIQNIGGDNHGERVSVSLCGGLGPLPPVVSRGQALVRGLGAEAYQRLNEFYNYWLNFHISWQILRFNRCAAATIDKSAKDRAKRNIY